MLDPTERNEIQDKADKENGDTVKNMNGEKLSAAKHTPKDITILIICCVIYGIFTFITPSSDDIYLKVAMYFVIAFGLIKFLISIFLLQHFARIYLPAKLIKRRIKILLVFLCFIFALGIISFDSSGMDYQAMQNTLAPLIQLAAIAEHCGVPVDSLNNIVYEAEINYLQSPNGKSWYPIYPGDQDSQESLQNSASSVLNSAMWKFYADQTMLTVKGNNYIQHINAHVEQPTPTDSDFTNAYQRAFYSCDGALTALKVAGYDVQSSN